MASTNSPDGITLSNNHNNPIISQVDLNNQIYDIHDDNAVHTLADLAGLGFDTSSTFVFKGTVATKNDLPTANESIKNHVYHVVANGSEYICALTKDTNEDDIGDAYQWEEFGEHFVVDHTHAVGAQEITFTPNISVTPKNLSVSITTTTQEVLTNLGTSTTASVVTGITTGQSNAVTSVSITSTAKAITGISTTTANFVNSVTTSGTGTAVGGITTTTQKVITAVTTSAATTVSFKGISNVGTASSWSFSVSNGILTVSGENSTVPTTASYTASKIGSNGDGSYATGATTTAAVTKTVGTTTSNSFVTGITTSTNKAVTVVEASSTADAATAITTSTAKFTSSVTTSGTAKAITGFGTHSTVKVVKTVNSSLTTVDTGGIEVSTNVTGSSQKITIPGQNTGLPQ